jgi:lipoyl synthase
MGFLHASSGPLVRSSYRAAEVFVRSLLTGEVSDPAKIDAALHARLEEARRGAQRVSLSLGEEGPQLAPPADRPAGAGAADRPGSAGAGGSGSGLVPAGSLVRRA